MVLHFSFSINFSRRKARNWSKHLGPFGDRLGLDRSSRCEGRERGLDGRRQVAAHPRPRDRELLTTACRSWMLFCLERCAGGLRRKSKSWISSFAYRERRGHGWLHRVGAAAVEGRSRRHPSRYCL